MKGMQEFFTYGSTRKRVKDVMNGGRGDFWLIYGEDWVSFDEKNTVNGWSNKKGTLKVSFGEPVVGASQIRVGSSTEDIGRAIGTPIELMACECWFDDCEIVLDSNGKVCRWNNRNEKYKKFFKYVA